MRRKAHASGPTTAADTATVADTAFPPHSATADADGAAADWTTEALDRLDELIDKVRSNSTDRLVRIARIAVLGILVAIMGIAVLVLAVIALIRLLDEAIPGDVWIVYLGLGAILTGAGAFLWSRRSAPTS